jgi:rhodanese-related sulfurtransferase
MRSPSVLQVLVVAFGVAVIGLLTGSAIAAEVPTITKEELRAKLGDPNVVVVDVRQPRDWKASDVKIKGAIRENPGDIAGWADRYPKDKTLVLYCA